MSSLNRSLALDPRHGRESGGAPRARRLLSAGMLFGVSCLSVAQPAWAQIRSDCRSPQPPSVGVAVGGSSPYEELLPDPVETTPVESRILRGGMQIAGRADLPVVGPVRLRIEGSTAWWEIRRRTYDPEAAFRLVAETSDGRIAARHLVALAGLRRGLSPVCGHVLVGGGLYTIGYPGGAVRHRGVSIAAGIEVPAGRHSVIQADLQLHLIGARNRHPSAVSLLPSASLLVGWSYRF